jgi:hypothetical protein
MTRASALLVLNLCVLGSIASRSVAAGDKETDSKPNVRIGTYDSRAIAIAHAHSRFNPVREKTAAYEKAKAAGDREKIKELESWGEEHQRQLHFQGFGRVPVDDLLAPVKDQMAKLARDRRLAAISMSCDFVRADVEIVDITDELVELYDPSEKTLERVQGIRKVKPVPLTQIADVPARN